MAGYAILVKGFSTEAGGRSLWLEELYVMPEYQGRGLGKEFFQFLFDAYGKDVCRFRLEVEADNQRAIQLYRKLGFQALPYVQMVKDL